MTAHHVHTVFGACLGAAVRTKVLAVSPMAHITAVPSKGGADHGMVLDQEQLRALVEGFRGSVLFPIVATLAFTGCRRSEALALQWDDLDVGAKTLQIQRAVDQTDEGLALKGPKTANGKRTITIDDDLIALRIVAGVPDGVAVDLSLVKLPDGALMFPGMPGPGEGISFTKLRNPDNTTKEFVRRARKLGFVGLRLHDLRGSHETALLDAGMSVHVVAQRCGHDPAVLLRSYAKRTKGADTQAAAIIGAMFKGVLR